MGHHWHRSLHRRNQLSSPGPSIHLFLVLLLILTGLYSSALQAIHTYQTKPLRRLLARIGAALELRAHSSIGLRDRALLDHRVGIGLNTAAAGELVELVVAHLDDGGRFCVQVCSGVELWLGRS